MEKVQTMIEMFRAKMQGNRIGANTLRLEWALQVLDLKISIEQAKDAEQILVDAAESSERCKGCTKSGEETVYCIKADYTYENGQFYQRCGLCKKGQAYLKSRRIAKLFADTGLGKRFMQRTFENFEVTSTNKSAYEKCKRFCEEFTPESTGLLLVGGYGTGKTHLAAAIIMELLKKDVVGVFVVVADLLRCIKKSFDDKELSGETRRLIEMTKTAELLVLDDLGAEKSTEWTQEQLFMLINARYENMLPTIITTNYDLEDLIEKIGQRTVSRIVEMTGGAMLIADDYRLRKLRGEQNAM